MAFPAGFRMPRPIKITNRTSSITNSFVNGIIPIIQPTEGEVLAVLAVLEMKSNDVRCAYCGDPSTEWDHFEPIVAEKRPTGFITEIANLVPACGKCNQSKSGSPWRTWISGPAAKSPKTRGIPDLNQRIKRLERFDRKFKRWRIDFQSVVPAKLWKAHWENHDKLLQMMQDSLKISELVKHAACKSLET